MGANKRISKKFETKKGPEKKERKRTDITPEVFFMYTLSEMLIKGNKFSIKCVPDSVIEKFKKELKDE